MVVTRVYVEGLPKGTTVRDLEHFFEGYGILREIKYMRRTYAFIGFDDSRDAENAIQKLNGGIISGKRITVEKANGKPYGKNKWSTSSGIVNRTPIHTKSSHVGEQVLKDCENKSEEVNFGNTHKPYSNKGAGDFASHSDVKTAKVSHQYLDNNCKNLLRHECPNCFSYVYPPSTRCSEVHCFCSDCPNYISKCEVCRGVMSKSRIITLQRAQSSVNHSCRYNKIGCDYVGSGIDLASHHVICRMAMMECPLKFMKCNWFGKSSQMPRHCAENHPNNFHFVTEKDFLISNFVEVEDKRCDMIFNVFNTFFRCIWDLNKESGGLKIAMYHVGSPLTYYYDQFSFRVVIHSKSINSEAITLGGPICQMFNYNDRFVAGKYFPIKHGFVKGLCDEVGDLHLTVSISKGTGVN